MNALGARAMLADLPARDIPLGVDGLTVARRIDRDRIRSKLRGADAIRVKAAVVGDSIGKTTALVRWLGGGAAQPAAGGDDASAATVGINSVDVAHTAESGRPAKVTLWDMGGSPSYFEIRTEFYREATDILLCFSPASRASFQSLATWKAEIAKASPDLSKVLVVALVHPGLERHVGDDEAARWAQGLNLGYYEVNTSNGEGARELLGYMVRKNER